jgi:hypothetical protein
MPKISGPTPASRKPPVCAIPDSWAATCGVGERRLRRVTASGKALLVAMPTTAIHAHPYWGRSKRPPRPASFPATYED